MEGDALKVLDKLRRLCSRREYCTSDILKKASEALDGDHNRAEEVLQVLVRYRYGRRPRWRNEPFGWKNRFFAESRKNFQCIRR